MCLASHIPSVSYDDTLRDRSWMWGHESWQVDGKHAKLYGLDVATNYYHMVDGAKSYGLENLNVVRWDKPDKAFRDSLKVMKRLTWPLSGNAGEDHTTYAELGDWTFAVAEEMENVTGFELDDYFVSTNETPTFADTPSGRKAVCPARFKYDELVALKRRMENFKRPLELRLVIYDDLFKERKDPRDLQPVIDVADSVTYWVWMADNMKKLEKNFAEYRRLAPKKPTYLGIYLWNFGGAKPMPLDLLKHQLELGLKWFRKGEIEGFVFLCSSICNRPYPAVTYCREWLRRHGDERWGSERTPTFPLYSLRFSAYQSDGGVLWAETLKMLDAYPGTIDEVWFSSGTCLPPLDWHHAQAARQAAAAVELRQRGIAPSLQLHATIGHSDSISAAGSSGGDCSAKDWRGWTGPTGQEDLYCSCPRDPKFIAYFVEVAKIYATYRPPSVWFDDDLRIEGHKPASPWGLGRDRRGCWCERCLGDFSKEEGKSYDRVALQTAMAKDPTLVDRWERFQFGSLAQFASKVVEAFHAVSPKTMFGYQHNIYPNDCQSIVYRAIRAASGGNALGCRPGGGYYFDHSPYDQLEKAYFAAREFRNIGMPDIELVCPEVESCPRTFSCRTGQGVLLEALESLAMGMNSVSLFIMNCKEETPAFFTRRFMKPLSGSRKFFADYIAHNRRALPTGLRTNDGKLPTGMQLSCGIPLVEGYAHDCGVLEMADVDATAISSPRLMNLYAQADRAANGRLAALPLEPVQGWILPRTLKDGTLRSVVFINTTIDRSEPFALRLRGVSSDVHTATWRALGGETAEVEVVRDEGGARVTVPAVGPWNGGWLAL